MSQFTLPLGFAASFSADHFIVSDCNRAAHDAVLRWPHWDAHALYLSGPPGSGTTHLSQIWAQRSGAVMMMPDHIAPELATQPVLVEDVECCTDEAVLFHLFNHCKENGVGLLLVSQYEPQNLPFTLPDLTSRLRAMPRALLHAPDDALLAAVLRKQFSDRQLMVDDEVLAYIAARAERSLTAMAQLVEILDLAALAAQKNITIPFAKQILGY